VGYWPEHCYLRSSLDVGGMMKEQVHKLQDGEE